MSVLIWYTYVSRLASVRSNAKLADRRIFFVVCFSLSLIFMFVAVRPVKNNQVAVYTSIIGYASVLFSRQFCVSFFPLDAMRKRVMSVRL